MITWGNSTTWDHHHRGKECHRIQAWSSHHTTLTISTMHLHLKLTLHTQDIILYHMKQDTETNEYTTMTWEWTTFFAAHKQLSAVGEAGLGRGTESGNGTVLEITEETENGTEAVIGKGRERGFVTGTETEVKEVDTEDNLSGTSAHLKQKSLYFFVCLQVVYFISSCLLKFRCVEGFIMTLFIPSMQWTMNWKNSDQPNIEYAKLTQLDISIGAEWETVKNVDID